MKRRNSKFKIKLLNLSSKIVVKSQLLYFIISYNSHSLVKDNVHYWVLNFLTEFLSPEYLHSLWSYPERSQCRGRIRVRYSGPKEVTSLS